MASFIRTRAVLKYRAASMPPGAILRVGTSRAACLSNHAAAQLRRTDCMFWPKLQSRLPTTTSGPRTSFYRGYADFPEHIEVRLPAMSPTMETGTIVSWEVSEGAEVDDGDVLAQVETDKATMDMETPRAGFLAKILVPEGSKDIPLGKLLCIVVEEESNIGAFKDYQPPESTTPPASQQPASPEPEVQSPPQQSTPAPPTAPPPQPKQPGDRVIASPFAKTLASQQGINLQGMAGSGPGGRIVSRDVLGAQQPAMSAPAPSLDGAYTDIELTNMRKTIAKRLQESKQSIPHYYLTVDITMDNIMKLREEFNKDSQDAKLSVNDFLIKAAALSMKSVPEVNSSWMDSFVRQHHNVDVSVAVSTSGGLITPIVFGAHNKGLRTINADVKELAEKARDGKLQPHEFQGGTFTISNLGMFGIKQFTAVINPPQSCILAAGSVERRMIVDESSVKGYRTADVLTVTLSCDHRVVDGAVGAQWLKVFKSLLEKPQTMIL